jgi:hypothetical protein
MAGQEKPVITASGLQGPSGLASRVNAKAASGSLEMHEGGEAPKAVSASAVGKEHDVQEPGVLGGTGMASGAARPKGKVDAGFGGFGEDNSSDDNSYAEDAW